MLDSGPEALVGLTGNLKIRVDGHGVTLFNEKTRKLHMYNQTGSKILLALATPRRLAEIKSVFSKSSVALGNVDAFLGQLLNERNIAIGTVNLPRISVYNFRPIKDISTPFYTPLGLEVELTRRCLRCCTYCAYDSAPDVAESQNLSVKQLFSLIEEASNAGVFFVRFSGGDPFLHPNLVGLAQYASDLGIQVTIASDLSVFSPDTLRSLAGIPNMLTLKTTLDGSTSQTADKLRGGGQFQACIAESSIYSGQ